MKELLAMTALLFSTIACASSSGQTTNAHEELMLVSSKATTKLNDSDVKVATTFPITIGGQGSGTWECSNISIPAKCSDSTTLGCNWRFAMRHKNVDAIEILDFPAFMETPDSADGFPHKTPGRKLWLHGSYVNHLSSRQHDPAAIMGGTGLNLLFNHKNWVFVVNYNYPDTTTSLASHQARVCGNSLVETVLSIY